MTLTWSRALSLVTVVIAYLRVWHIGASAWLVTLYSVPMLLLIWFPSGVDDLTFGAWYRGNRIDTHMPAFLIAAFGWIFLLLLTALLFNPRIVVRSAGG